MRSKLAFCCGAFLVASQVNAETIDFRLAKLDVCGGYEVLHVNGINTSLEGARANLGAIADKYGNAHEGHLLRYGLAYNRTNWIIADLQQSYTQLIAAYPGVSFRDWLRAVINGIWPSSVPASAIADFAGRVGSLLGLNRPNPYTDPDLDRMLNEIAGFHGNGARMAMVAHSQGTIYANFLYDRMTDAAPAPVKIPASRVGLVDVAAVVEGIRGGGNYVTSSSDLVVNFVRLAAVNTLRATTTLRPSLADWKGHAFIEIYLAQASNAITNNTMQTLTTLAGSLVSPWNGAYISQGASFQVCGPEMDRPPPQGPCYVGGQMFTVPIVTYVIPGVGNQVRPGSAGEIDQLATDAALGCVAALAEEWKRVALAGRGDVNVAGCGGNFHASEDISAWAIYSSDYVNLQVLPSAPTVVRVAALPACRS